MIYTNIAIALFTFGFITWLFTLKTKVKYVVIAITLFVSFNMFSVKKTVEIEALEFNKQTIEELNNKGQHVFVDFTAKWCLTCQYNKKTVLTSEEFINTLKQHNIKFMIADWTDKDSNISTELASLGRSGVPVYAIYNAHTKQALVLPEILTNKAVKEAISKLE
jgi:thiol:disulfide interchange protein DsbD